MSDTNTDTSKVVTYGSHTIDFAAQPHASLMAMLSRGVTHFLGSEMAAKVDAYYKRTPKDGEPAKRPDTEQDRADLKAEYQLLAVKALNDGTVGVSNRGPAVDPLEAAIESVARKEVLQTLRDNKTKVPKKADQKVAFADGSAYTIAELVERRIANPKHADRIKGVAQAELDRKAKEAAKVAKTVAGSGLADLL